MANIKMEERKTIRVLKKLNKNEFKRFTQRLGHGYFKTSENVVLLLSFLTKYFPDFSDKKFNNKTAVQFISRKTKKDFTSKQLNNVFSKLFPLIELFLQIEHLLNDKLLATQTLANDYNQRGLSKSFKRATEDAFDGLNEIKEKDAIYYNQKAELNHNLYFHPHSDLLDVDVQNLKRSDEDRTLAFIIKKLQVGCELLQSQRIKKNGYNFNLPFLKEVIQFAKKNYSENAIVKMYLDIIHLAQNEYDQTLMEQLVDDFSESCTLFNLTERSGVLTFLTNELTHQETKGNLNYPLKLRLYQLGEKNNCLIYHNTISSQVFINICLTANRIKGNTYSESFLKENSKYLPVEERKYIVKFCKADLLFFQNNFEKAFQLFKNNNNGSPSYLKYRNRSMCILSEYELFQQDHSYDETFQNSLENYIRNFQSDRQTDLIDNKKNIYLAFGTFLYTIFKEKIRFQNGTTNQHIQRTTKDELLKKLSLKKGIAAKWWLTQKINQL